MPNKTHKSINKNKIVCAHCKTFALETQEALQCDVCEKTLHSLCSKLDKKEYDKLVNNPTIEYTCHLCNPKESVTVNANDMLEIKTKLNQLDEIRESMRFMSSQYDSILKGVAKNTKDLKQLKKENDYLREGVKSLKSTVKLLNDFRVLKDCVINGITSDEQRKAIDVVLDVAEKKTGTALSANEVEDAYFLNRSTKNNNKSIVVKFTTKRSKVSFMEGKSNLKEIDGLRNIFINDFLSKESMELLNYAKSLKAVGFNFVYIRSGNIFVKRNAESKQIVVKSKDDVDKLLRKSAGGADGHNASDATNMSENDTHDEEDEL